MSVARRSVGCRVILVRKRCKLKTGRGRSASSSSSHLWPFSPLFVSWTHSSTLFSKNSAPNRSLPGRYSVKRYQLQVSPVRVTDVSSLASGRTEPVLVWKRRDDACWEVLYEVVMEEDKVLEPTSDLEAGRSEGGKVRLRREGGQLG